MLEFKYCIWIIMSQGRFRQVPATFEMLLLLLLPVSARARVTNIQAARIFTLLATALAPV
jgi:hypothetical protein